MVKAEECVNKVLEVTTYKLQFTATEDCWGTSQSALGPRRLVLSRKRNGSTDIELDRFRSTLLAGLGSGSDLIQSTLICLNI